LVFALKKTRRCVLVVPFVCTRRFLAETYLFASFLRRFMKVK
jgi:hypothetical protein